jgi:serine/threonine protein kinase
LQEADAMSQGATNDAVLFASWSDACRALGGKADPALFRRLLYARGQAGRHWIENYIREAQELAAIQDRMLARCIQPTQDFLGSLSTAPPWRPLGAWFMRRQWQGSEADNELVRQVFGALLDALSMLHQHGFVHLNIQPATVLIRDPNAVILGGLASARRYPCPPNAAPTNFIPHFAAPEQLAEAAERLGPGTDLYSAAATLLYGVTGRLPPLASTSHNPVAQLRRFVEREAGQRLPFKLRHIVSICMSPAIEDRYRDARELRHLVRTP